MPGFLAIGARGVDFSRLGITFEGPGPLVTGEKVCRSAYIARFTNPKFLRDKVFEDDDDLCIALDGVVFNFEDLQRQYKTQDYFQTVKAMYGQRGDRFVESFRGEFAGVLHDKRRDRWVAFTNHTASKPLFYFHAPDLFICSTQFDAVIRALRACGRRYSLDVFGAYCLLTYGYMLEDTTLIATVKKLKAGNYLVLDNGSLTVDSYVRFRNEPCVRESKEEIIENLDRLFRRAVATQYEKDREYGYDHVATLSGGLDSRMNLWVANEMGYKPQVALTFSQSGYLDAQIANRVASDLRTEFVFYSLDHGHYLQPAFGDAIRANGGLTLFSGSAALLRALNRLDMSRLGMLHTGMVGDAVLGSFLEGVSPCKAKVPAGAYSAFLMDRIAPDVQTIMDRYETEDEFLMYNRGFNGALNGNWTTYLFTECTSPFLDLEFLDYAMRIPRAIRLGEQIYFDWILAKHPGVARYPWEKTKAKISDGLLVQKLKMLWWMAGVVLRWRWEQISMNPFKSWAKTNPALVRFFQEHWDANSHRLDGWPELKADCVRMFEGAGSRFMGPLIARTQVMTLVEAVRLYFG